MENFLLTIRKNQYTAAQLSRTKQSKREEEVQRIQDLLQKERDARQKEFAVLKNKIEEIKVRLTEMGSVPPHPSLPNAAKTESSEPAQTTTKSPSHPTLPKAIISIGIIPALYPVLKLVGR